MHKEEINKQIDELKKQIAALEQKLETLPVEKWHPEYGKTYYFPSSAGEICTERWSDYHTHHERLELGHVFKTKEDVKFEVERLKVLTELRDYAEKDPVWNNVTPHWALIYHYESGVNLSCFYSICVSPIVFESKEIAEAAIAKIGEDRIKKYYFEIEEDKKEENPFLF